MAVEIKIVNNTPNTIVLDKDEYLRGVAKALVPKEEILELYPNLIQQKNSDWWGGVITGATGTILTPLCVLFMFVKPSQNAHYGRGNAPLSRTAMVLMGGAGALIFGAMAVTGFYVAHSAGKTIKKATAKRDSLADLTCHYTNNRRAVSHYSANAHRYKIRPGQTFRDMIFINLKRVDRDFFDLVTPRLDYSTKKRG